MMDTNTERIMLKNRDVLYKSPKAGITTDERGFTVVKVKTESCYTKMGNLLRKTFSNSLHKTFSGRNHDICSRIKTY